MIDKDFWQEVLQTIRQQKWRSLMTAFGIFWGLLMLMFLIGAGVGFQEGIAGQLKQMPANSIFYASRGRSPVNMQKTCRPSPRPKAESPSPLVAVKPT